MLVQFGMYFHLHDQVQNCSDYKELSAFFENLPKKILGFVYYDTFRLKKEQKTMIFII
jgi:hypothetical protein